MGKGVGWQARKETKRNAGYLDCHRGDREGKKGGVFEGSFSFLFFGRGAKQRKESGMHFFDEKLR